MKSRGINAAGVCSQKGGMYVLLNVAGGGGARQGIRAAGITSDTHKHTHTQTQRERERERERTDTHAHTETHTETH